MIPICARLIPVSQAVKTGNKGIGTLAQLAERIRDMDDVIGSNPVRTTIKTII